jgi:hypothetical protein
VYYYTKKNKQINKAIHFKEHTSLNLYQKIQKSQEATKKINKNNNKFNTQKFKSLIIIMSYVSENKNKKSNRNKTKESTF